MQPLRLSGIHGLSQHCRRGIRRSLGFESPDERCGLSSVPSDLPPLPLQKLPPRPFLPKWRVDNIRPVVVEWDKPIRNHRPIKRFICLRSAIRASRNAFRAKIHISVEKCAKIKPIRCTKNSGSPSGQGPKNPPPVPASAASAANEKHRPAVTLPVKTKEENARILCLVF